MMYKNGRFLKFKANKTRCLVQRPIFLEAIGPYFLKSGPCHGLGTIGLHLHAIIIKFGPIVSEKKKSRRKDRQGLNYRPILVINIGRQRDTAKKA